MTNGKINLSAAVESKQIENSTTLTKENVGEPNLLNRKELEPSYDATGTALVLQNSIQVSDISRSKDEHDLKEIEWTYKKTTSKPFIVKAYTWSTANSIGDEISKFNFPQDYFLANHSLRNVGDTFLSMRGDLHFVLTAQGTPVSSGALIISPDYWPYEVVPGSPLNDAFVRQFSILDISDNTSTADLVIPFKYFRNGIDPFDISTVIRAHVLAPLQGINEVTLTLTVFLENQEFKFLRPVLNTTLKNFRNKDFVEVKENIPQETTETAKLKSLLTNRTQGLINVTTINNELSQVENATLPTNMKGDELAVDTSLMDDVGIPTNPQAVIMKFNSMNNSDNPQAIEKMALISKSQRVSTKSTFNTTMDEMSIKHILCEREHLIEEFKLTKDITPGSPVLSINVVPTPTVSSAANNTTDTVNLFEYVCDKYRFWRGGMKYRLRFYMNRFQSIKLYCGMFYKTAAPVAFTDWSASHGAIIDIGGDQREVTIEIPYNSETPWLQVPHGYLRDQTFVDLSAYDFSLGQFSIYAATPLISPEGSPNDIRVVMTMMAADDFEVANFTPANRTQSDVVLSKRSIRTPNYITDVIPSIKNYFSKWQSISVKRGIRMVGVHNYLTLFCGEVFARLSKTPSIASDKITLHKLETTRFEHLIHSHYSGSLKFRIELSKFVSSDEKHDIDKLVPYCYYVNPDQHNIIDVNTDVIQQIANALEMYKTKPTENITTPYIAQPINGGLGSTTTVWEVEVPMQRNIKYLPVHWDFLYRPLDYGYLLFGFTNIDGERVDPSTNKMSVEVFAKIGDDGRFATIENGLFTYQRLRQPTWCLEYLPE